jgi:radical SAM protein with 4Fe4S-binding SPASM domain
LEDTLLVSLDVPLAFRPLSRIVSGSQSGVCNILHVLGVLPNGEYALCGAGQHEPELMMGQVADQPLARLWQQHPLLQSLRAGLPQQLQGICGRCLMKAACKGSCVAANYQAGGDLFAPYWFCQQAMDAGIFPISRLAKKVSPS